MNHQPKKNDQTPEYDTTTLMSTVLDGFNRQALYIPPLYITFVEAVESKENYDLVVEEGSKLYKKLYEQEFNGTGIPIVLYALYLSLAEILLQHHTAVTNITPPSSKEMQSYYS